MRKFYRILAMMLCIISVVVCSVAANDSTTTDNVNIIVDGETVMFDSETDITKSLMHVFNTTYIPVKTLAQWNGKVMSWDDTTNTFTFTTPDSNITAPETSKLSPDMSDLINDYKSLCKNITWNTYSNTSVDTLNGQRYIIAGEVSEIIQEENRVIVTINIKKTKYHYTGTVYVEMSHSLYNDNIDAGDLIAVWGVFDNTYTYTYPDNPAIQFTKPLLKAKYFELYDESFPEDIYVEGITVDPAADQTDSESSNEKIYGPNEKWVVDGEWELTIHSVKTHTRCNRYDNSNGYEQIVIVTYTYKNLGYDRYSHGKLKFDFTNMDIYDCNNDIGTYYSCTDEKESQYIDKENSVRMHNKLLKL